MTSFSRLFIDHKWLGLFLAIAFTTGCTSGDQPSGKGGNSQSNHDHQITAINYPIAALLKKGLDEKYEVMFPNPKEGEIPSDAEIQAMQKGPIVVVAGKHQAGWIDAVSISELKRFHIGLTNPGQLISVANLGSHRHGPTGFHSHSGVVEESWLDPELFATQLTSLAKHLEKQKIIESKHKDALISSTQQTLQPLVEKCKKLRQTEKQKWLADHAGTEYLCRRLNLEPVIVELSEGYQSDRLQLKKTLEKWSKTTKGIILTQQHPPEILKMLEEANIKHLSWDLLSKGELKGVSREDSANNYLKRMESNLEKFKKFVEK